MFWFEQSDNYCERTDLTYWSEPVNALSNACFVIAAAWMWRRCAGNVGAQTLCVILFCIGIGSFLFHTHATNWAALTDVVPIGAFILVYLFLVNRDVVGLPMWASLLMTAAFVPYAAVMVPILTNIPFLAISNFYWTVPVLLVIYGVCISRRAPGTAHGFFIGATLLCVSIAVRSIDESLCAYWPMGTHIGWHVLNAVMLGWMIEVYLRHGQTASGLAK